jgi:predicted PurR-regulated permease PerM
MPLFYITRIRKNIMSAAQTFRNMLVVLGTLAIAVLAYYSLRIIVVLILAIIIASALRPIVIRLQKLGWREPFAITAAYALLIGFLIVLFVFVVNPAVRQVSDYYNNPDTLKERLNNSVDWLETSLTSFTGSTVNLVAPEQVNRTVDNIITEIRTHGPKWLVEGGTMATEAILVVVLGIYWLSAREQATQYVMELFPLGRRARIAEIWTKIELVLGAYIRGLAGVCTFVGVANFALLTLFGVPNAPTLGLIVGVTNAIPILGGYIGAGMAVLLALLSSPVHAALAFLSFVLVQQVENHYLTPRMMARSIHMNPILVIVFLFTGFSVGGVLGALLAIPVAGALTVILQDLVIEPRKREAAPKVVQGAVLLPTGPNAPADAPPAAVVTPKPLVSTSN